MDLGSSWIDSGHRLTTIATNWSIGSHFCCLQAHLGWAWRSLGVNLDDLGIQNGCYR